VGDTLYMLTWREGLCLLFGIPGLTPLGSFEYEGEGWGLAFDGTNLLQSDGSSCITVRDPSDFEPVRLIEVTISGRPLDRLNELEYRDGILYANVWTTDFIARIDPSTGHVLSLVDASGLLEGARRATADVMNGIAFDDGSGRFCVTGKFWPSMFLVDLEGGAQ